MLRLMFSSNVDVLSPQFDPAEYAPDFRIPKDRADAEKRGLETSDADIADNNLKRSIHFMYSRHCMAPEGSRRKAFLEAMLWDDGAFAEFLTELDKHYSTEGGNPPAGPIDDEALRSLLKDFLMDIDVGYVLRQGREDGALSDRMELDDFFPPDEDGISDIITRAEKSRVKMLVAFEE